MSVEKEIAVSLVLKAQQYKQGMTEANKDTKAFTAQTQQASQALKGFEDGTKKAGVGLRAFEDGTTGAAKGAKKVEQATQAAKDALKNLTSEVRTAQKELGQLEQKHDKLGAASKRLLNEMVNARQALKDLKDANAAASKSLGDTEKAADRAAEKLKRVESATEEARKKLQGFKEGASGVSAGSAQAESALINLGKAASTVRSIFGALALGMAAKEMFDFAKATVDANEQMNGLKGSIAAVVSANQTVKDSSGNVVTGVEKILAVQTEVSDLFKQIQIDALKTSDTTQGLITKLSVALGPGMADGMSIKQIKDLTVAASVAMSALKIDESQAASEMRALLSGEQLDNAQLAQAIGLRHKADIDGLIKSGKLYDELMKKMADFKAAGELQSRSLTGVLSSLDDVGQKLMQIIGEDATGSLTHGFQDVLDSILTVDSNGVAHLDKGIENLALNTGLYVDDMAKDFVWLTKQVVSAAKWMGEALAQVNFAGRLAKASVTTDFQKQGIRDRMFAAKIPVNPLNGELLPQWMTNLSDDQYEDKKKIFEYYQGEFKRLDSVKTQEIDKGYKETIGAVDWKADPRNPRNKKAGNGKHTFTNNKVVNTDDKAAKAAAKEAEQKDKSAVTQLMADMRNELQINDAKELGFSGRLEIEAKYIKLLKAHFTAASELKGLEFDHQITQIELTKKRIALADEQAKRAENVKKIEQDSQKKLLEIKLDRETDIAKQTADKVKGILEDQYRDGTIKAEEYFSRLKKIKDDEIKLTYDTERRKLQAERETLQERFNVASGRKGKKYSPEEVATLKATIGEVDSRIAGLNPRMNAELDNNSSDAYRGLTDAVTNRLGNSIQSAFSIAGPGAASILSDSVKKSLVNMLKGSEFGNAISSIFGDGGIGSDLANTAQNVDGLLNIIKQGDLGRTAFNNSLSAQYIGGMPFSRTAQQTLINQQVTDLERAAREANGKGRPIWESDAVTPQQAIKINLIKKQMEQKADEDEARRADAKVDRDLQRALKAEEDKNKALEAQGQKADNRMRDHLISEEIFRLKEKLKTEKMSEDYRLEVEQKVYDLQSTLDDEILQNKLDAIAMEKQMREEMVKQQADNWEAFTQRAIGDLRRLQDEAQKALDTKSADNDILAIYGINSKTENEFTKNLAQLNLNKQTISQLSASNTTQQGIISGLFGGLASNNNLRLTNANGSKDVAWMFQQLGIDPNGKQGNFQANQSNFVHDLGEFVKWIGMGVQFQNRTTGQMYSQADFQNYINQYNSATGLLNSNNGKITDLNTQNATINANLNTQVATVRAGAADLLKGMGLQIQELQAGNNPELLKALKLAQIDAQIKEQKDAIFQNGYLSDYVDAETQTKIRDNLDVIRDLMKAQVNQQSYSDANPLPVKVVAARNFFPLPTSAYFRGENRPTMVIGAGAITIQGTNLSEGQLRSALTGAIADLGGPLTKVVNRENSIQTSQMTTG